MSSLSLALSLPPSQLSVMQSELKTVKEFRKKRAEMEVQLVQLRATLTETERQHQVALQALEQRFFEEKVHVRSLGTPCWCVST